MAGRRTPPRRTPQPEVPEGVGEGSGARLGQHAVVGQGGDQLGLVGYETLVDTVELVGGEVPEEVQREDLQFDGMVVVGVDGRGDLDRSGDVDARARNPQQAFL